MYAILLMFPSGKQMQRNLYEDEKHGKVNIKIAGLKLCNFFMIMLSAIFIARNIINE